MTGSDRSVLPLDDAARAKVERAWEIARPLIERYRRHHERIEADGWIAEIFCRHIPGHCEDDLPFERYVLWMAKMGLLRGREWYGRRGEGRRPIRRKCALLDARRCDAAGSDPTTAIEAADHVRARLSRLRPEQVDWLWRVEIDGESQEDLAADLGISAVAMRKRIERARDAARRAMGDGISAV